MGDRDIFVGVDVGGTKILSCPLIFTGGGFKVIGEQKKKTKHRKGITEVIDRIVETVMGSLENAHLTVKDIRGIGLGLPGAVNSEEGVVLFAPNIEWKNVHLKEILEDELKVPCFMDNDVNMGTFGEILCGAGAGVRNAVGIFWGTGIGGGIIIDGKVMRGFNFTAGEVGHIKLQIDGPKCGCGGKGCLEALASRGAISTELLEAVKGVKKTKLKLDAEDIEAKLIRSGPLKDALLSGDKLVTGVLMKAAETVGVAVGSIINLLGPEMIIVGGGVIESMGAELMPVIREAAEKNSFPFAYKGVKIVEAKLGDYAVLVGAALFARDELGEK